MCGIIGIVGDQAAAPLILYALKKLEYRGYDSAGMAMNDNSQIIIRKGAGKLDEVEKACQLGDLPGTAGIGHVRWATHGGVTATNAHPHTDCSGKIAVVHNGIIENFQELKDLLGFRHTFISQTDTEVIAHLIEEEYFSSSRLSYELKGDEAPLPLKKGDTEGFSHSPETPSSQLTTRCSLEIAVYRATRKLKGSYAILVISSLEPQKIVAARQDSPLVIGLGEKTGFLASDTLCFPQGTQQAVYVEDGETVVLTHNVLSGVEKAEGYALPLIKGDTEGFSLSPETGHTPSLSGRPEESAARREDLSSKLETRNSKLHTSNSPYSVFIYDHDFNDVHREPVKLDYRPEEVSKQGHRYFMLKEIFEQPHSIRQALMQDDKLVMDMAIDMLRSRHIVLTGCGTSRNAALVGRYVFSKLTGIFSEVVIGSEFQYFTDSLDKNTVVIAISQSGETADVLQGVRKAKEVGATVFSLVNTRGSTLARMSDKTLYLHCGPEIAVAATKSFISQLAIFYLLAFAMINRIKEGKEKMLPVSNLIEENLAHNNAGLAQLAETLKEKNNFYYLGRGINYSIAGEGALKLKEIAYVHAEGMPAGELKHGTLALVESGTPVVAICPNDYTFDETISNVLETKARGARVIGVSDKPHAAYDQWVHIPKVEEIFYPLVSVIPLQLLAYHSALARDYDPDKPRNLAKSVTVK